MKKILIFIFAASISILVAAKAPHPAASQDHLATWITGLPAGWTTPLNISNTPTDSEVAVMAVDDNGKAYVAWTEWLGGVGDERQILFNTNRTGSWGTPFNIGSLRYPLISDVGFPAIAGIHDGSKIWVAFHDGDLDLGRMVIYDREMTNGVWGPAFQNLNGTTGSTSYVTLSVAPTDNTLYAVWQEDVGGSFDLMLRSKDGASGQWSTPYQVGLIQPAAAKYLPNIFIDPKGTAHLVYIVRPDAVVWYAKNSTPKNPNTWTTPINISGATGLNFTYPKVTADGDGDAYVVWQSMVGDNGEIMLKRQINGVWQATENVSQDPGLEETATIAVDPITKEMFMTWQDRINETNWDVMLKTYEIQAGGQKAWSATYRLTSTPGHAGEPSIKMDSKGTVHLAYFDNPVGDGIAEIFYTMKVRPRTPKSLLNPAIATSLDNSGTKKINTITWQANPENAAVPLKTTKLWRKLSTQADVSYAVLASLAPTIFQYDDVGIDVKTNYSYRLTVVGQTDLESDPSAAVTSSKKFEFSALNPAVAVTMKRIRILFYLYQEKRVAFSFESNPLNVSGDISGYEIYRKKAEDGDDQFSLFATLDSSTFTYSYAIKPPASILQKYAYAVKTLFTDGTKSAFSNIATEAY